MTNTTMESYSQTLNGELVKKVKSQAYKAIEIMLFANEGSIHGGYVRDEIRCALPDDIDVSFKKNSDTDNFIQAIKNKKEFNEVSVITVSWYVEAKSLDKSSILAEVIFVVLAKFTKDSASLNSKSIAKVEVLFGVVKKFSDKVIVLVVPL